MKKLASRLAMTALVLSAVAAAPAPASAALPQCTRSMAVMATNEFGYRVVITLPVSPAGSSSCWMAQGNVSSGVAALQVALDHDYCANYPHPVAVDSIYGPQTRAGVVFIQWKYGLTQDGVYGPLTKSKIWWPDNLGVCAKAP